MMPRGAKKLALSKMHFAALAERSGTTLFI